MKLFQLFSLINYKPQYKHEFINHDLEDVVFNKAQQRLSLMIKVKEPLLAQTILSFEEKLANYFRCDVNIEISCQEPTIQNSAFDDYLKIISSRHQLRQSLIRTEKSFEKDEIVFLAMNEGEKDYIMQCLNLINDELKRYGITQICTCQLKPQEVNDSQIEPVSIMRNGVRYDFDAFVRVTISMLQDEMREVYFIGQCFKIDTRETRNNRFACTLYFTDFEDAIETVVYIDNPSDYHIGIGDWAKVYGNYEFDNYKKSNIFKNITIEKTEALVSYEDTAKDKRIELHAHSKASEMDGVSDVGALIKQAYDYQHPAIAITDHGAVHSFPSAQRAARSLNKINPDHQIKVIYGVEMNMIEDDLRILQGHHEFDFETGTFIVFDIETTGLSCRYDHIIEFGALKIENQMVTDSIQLFIKPPVNIPARITRLTQISDDMVKDAPDIVEAFKQIREFIKDGVLVAHNGMFDYRFLVETAKKLNEPPITNSLIDTLALSWAMLENRRSYTLGSVARYYRLEYDQNVAHRADYDAQILQIVFVNLMKELQARGVTNSSELHAYQKTVRTVDKARPYHVSVLAKNNNGLKDLYRLVSLSHTDCLMYRGKSSKKEDESIAQARILRGQINQYRKNLLIGSACFNSYLFELARTASQEELEAEMMFYDYIELQPIGHYEPLLYKGSILDSNHLTQILKNIYTTAKKLNKLIVATGDVHYVLKHEKVFREIYINAMGIGGAKHPLYLYDEQQRATQKSPDQHLFTTDEMLTGYPYLTPSEAFEIVVTNTHKVNDMIEMVEPVLNDLYTPTIEGSDEKLEQIVYHNAYQKYGQPLPEIVSERIVKELNSILSNGFGVIYYTSHLLVKKSLDDGYMVGSRGSVGSSLVATLANITEVNPLVPHYVCPSCHHSEFFTQNEYASGYDLPNKKCPTCETLMISDGQDIPFETFLGFEGDKVPDIDLNFSSDYQETAHAYTKELFGEDKVLRAGTIGTIAERTAFGLVSGYFENVPPLTVKHNAYREYLVNGATGVKRSTGQHPGGIIVVPKNKDILDFTPYQYPANNPEAAWRTTHFEYHDIENNVLKLDILGHVDPTAMKFLQDVSGLDVSQIPLNDAKTLSIFSSTDALMIDHRKQLDSNGAVGLPEFGTPFVRKMLEDTSPQKFSDLVRISGLSHGTDVWLKNAQDIISRGYTLDDVISCRDDIMTYLSHLGLSDKMSFNIMESVRKGRGLKPEWISEMIDHGVQDWYIQSAQMIKYLFPKAHAVAYCMMSFRVAWFKVHRPLDFYAQFFSLRCTAYEVSTLIAGEEAIKTRLNDILRRKRANDFENKVSAKEEQLINTLEVAYEMCIRGYSFKPMNLHEVHADVFWPDPTHDKYLLVPFNAVDGLGNQVAHRIVSERDRLEFLSIEDFKKRTQINQNALNELKNLGVLDDLSEYNQLSLF